MIKLLEEKIKYWRSLFIEAGTQLKVLREENNKLKALLIKAGSDTHKCKELHEWYCKQSALSVNKTERVKMYLVARDNEEERD